MVALDKNGALSIFALINFIIKKSVRGKTYTPVLC